MKNARIHLIYLAIIGFLTYQYWTKTQALNEAVVSIEQFDKLFQLDITLVDRASIMVKNEIDKQVSAYRSFRNVSVQEKAINAMRRFYSVKNWLNRQKTEFISFSGGVDKKDSTALANRLSSKANKQFFSDIKTKEIYDSLTQYLSILSDISDKKSLDDLQKHFYTPKLLTDNIYWQKLKNKTNADILTQINNRAVCI